MSKILGAGSAYAAAKEMPYCSNMSISANLVVELVERIAELEAEVSAWSDLWDEAMNAVERCARKEAWHGGHPLLVFQHTKALKEQGNGN